jgi:hypothetical protein
MHQSASNQTKTFKIFRGLSPNSPTAGCSASRPPEGKGKVVKGRDEERRRAEGGERKVGHGWGGGKRTRKGREGQA